MNLADPSGGAVTDEVSSCRRGSLKSCPLVFGALALLLLAGQVWFQASLADQSGDGRVINLAGRQRMLSQRLAATALVLLRAEDEAARRHAVAELGASVETLARDHSALRDADDAKGIQPRNSPAIRALFDFLRPHHEAMLQAARQLGRHFSAPDATVQHDNHRQMEIILREEPIFLAGMDEIVRHYEQEDRDRLARLQQFKIALAVVLVAAVVTGACCRFSASFRSPPPNPSQPTNSTSSA